MGIDDPIGGDASLPIDLETDVTGVLPPENGGAAEFDFDIPGAGLLVNLDSQDPNTVSIVSERVSTWTDKKNSLVFSRVGANNLRYDLNGIRFEGDAYLETPAFPPLNLTSAMTLLVVATVDNPTADTIGGFISHSSGASGYEFKYSNTPDGEARFNFAGVSDLGSLVTA